MLFVWLMTACDNDETSHQAPTSKIAIQATDVVECGFGGTKVAGPWDEVVLRADGSIKWTHVDAQDDQTAQPGFEKAGKLAADQAHDWMREVVALGLLDRSPRELPPKGERTICRGQIGGKPLDYRAEGLPGDELRGKLDALTAQAIQGS